MNPNSKERIEALAKASNISQKFYATRGDHCTSMDFFRASELRTNPESAEEVEKEKNNRQLCQDKEDNSKFIVVKMKYLTGGDIYMLFLWYQVPRKHWESVEWKNNWWQYVK